MAVTTSVSVNDLASRFTNWVSQHSADLVRPLPVSQAAQQWESWELDEQFLQALSRWTLDNPETTLDRVLDNIRDGLENSRDLLSLIPESPFPARGLVTALAYLLKLGISIRRAQRDVYDFAKDVVRWVRLVRSAFESAKDETFARRAWRDLRHMRELVNNVCLWAVERLNDGRWLRIGHGLTISKEIREFNQRIANAKGLFQDLSAINLSRGLDGIMRKLRSVVMSQQAITSEIQEIRKTQKKQLDRIVNELELQKQVAERERFFAKTLDLHAIGSSAYDSQGKRPCDKDTRVVVLDEIRNWRNNIKRGSPNFLWLTGDPGCGKSAVTASFARECKDEGVLWAQFFINRNNAETTDPRSYFPSIARQLADYSPEVAQDIHLTLVKQRSLTDDISAEQAARLFIDSIRKASILDPDRPVVVVIDGLDETNRDRLEDTATIFSELFTTLVSHGNVKVLISSRTENEIHKSFTLPLGSKHVKRVHLDTADPTCVRDVSLHIKRNLLELVRKNDLNWDVWPGNERSQALGERASGLFIWAVTAVKFIQEELELHGEECLDEVLNMLTAEVLDDINALYTLILTVAYRHRQDEWDFERFRRIVGAIVCLQEPMSIDDLSTLLDLRKTPSSKPVDIVHFVRRFRTILVTGTEAIEGTTIPRIHKSVYEFLTSSSVDVHFRVEPSRAHLELAIRCLGYFGTASEGFEAVALPMPLQYASRFWSSHFAQSNFLNSSALCVDYRSQDASASSTFYRLIDLSSYHSSRKLVRAHYSALASKLHIQFKLSDHFSVWDTASGLSITHTGSIRNMALSPDGRDIITCSDDGTIMIWDSTKAELKRRLLECPTVVYNAAISPDGKSVVSVSGDGMVCLWDYATGAPKWKSSQSTNLWTPVAFSHDGKWIVCGWENLSLLDALTGKAIGYHWFGHKAQVTCVVFSSSDRSVCSVDASGLCFIWDPRTGEHSDSWACGDSHQLDPKCIFSPNDEDLVAVYGDFGVMIRTERWKWSFSGSRDVHCLSFSPDGNDIIFGNHVGFSVARITRIAESEQSAQINKEGVVGQYSAGYLTAFSPNWDFAYFRLSEDNQPRVLALQDHETFFSAHPVRDDLHPFEKKQLMPNISSMKEMKNSLKNVTANQRLDTVKWRELVDVAENDSVKACLLTEGAIVAGYDNGHVTVWPLRNRSLSMWA